MTAPTGKKIVTAMDRIDEMLGRMSPEELKKLDRIAAEELAKPWLPTPGPQLSAYLSTANLLLYGGAAGGGKSLEVQTRIPTPSGWSTIGDVKVGDNVFDQDGNVCSVIGISRSDRERWFELEFDDGTKIIADDVHRWLTLTDVERSIILRRSDDFRARRRETRPSRAVAESKKPGTSAAVTLLNRQRVHEYKPTPAPSVRNTLEIFETQLYRGYRKNHSIEVATPFELPYASLLIEPYLFGLWLGDGHSASGQIGMLEDDWVYILPHIQRHMKWGRELPGYQRPFTLRSFTGLAGHLSALGVRGARSKRIPAQYLRASVEQRKQLLRGLLDTDGHCDPRGKIEIALSNRTLAENVKELVSSLGIKCELHTKFLSKKNAAWNDSHRLTFRADFPCFHLPRKLQRQALGENEIRDTRKRHYIVAVREVPKSSGRCLAVDSPSHTYLVTDSFIPTHNTDLICGLALTEHQRTVVFRSQSTDLNGFWERLETLCPQTTSRNSNLKRMVTTDNRLIECGHLDGPGSERAWQGRRHDLICFDESATIDARKINFVLGWLAPPADGSSNKARAILATNPPIGAEGAYLLEWFAPWLDPFYPNPAQTGELRWAVTVGDESEITTLWVDGPETIYLNADRSWRLATQEEEDYRPRLTQINKPQSRTFIPALLDDNPYLRDTDYRSQLQAKPEPLRSQLLHGSFLAGREDDEWQLIPSEWIREAQKRWQAPRGKVMISMGVDVAQGGVHKSTIAPLYDGNVFDKVMSWPGIETPDGKSLADKIILYRRDGANIAIDMTGGYGGSARDHLWHNHQIKIFPIVFSAAGPGGDSQTGYSFFNLRAKMYWQFRVALDPSKSGTAGHIDVALPPGDRILAQLAAPRWKPRSGKIVIEAKEDIQERLGSSPDEADAIVEAWHVRNMKAKVLSETASTSRTFGDFNSRSARLSWMG